MLNPTRSNTHSHASHRIPPRWWVLVLGFVLVGAALPMGILQSGLNQPEAVGTFLNDSLPNSTPQGVTGWDVQPVFPNLTFDDMIFMTPQPNSDQLYVGQRDGIVYNFTNDSAANTKNLFLDISDITAVVWDGGMLGMAFHPEFGQPTSSNRGYVYVYYCARERNATYPAGFTNGFFNCYLRLSRFTLPDGATAIDTTTEMRMINIRLYNGSHRGGGLAFGPDSMLYLTIGDQFNYGTAQDLVNNLEGGTLRMDVDMDPTQSHAPLRDYQTISPNPDEFSGIGYYIPDDNPFLDPGGGMFEEYFTVGNRAPHRMTYDSTSNLFWSGEIGGGQREELNVLKAGRNYGWPFREGTIGGPQGPPAVVMGTLQEPVMDFLRSEANAIIGGYVYRGPTYPSLQGKYLCGDYGQDRLWAVTYVDSTGFAEKEYLCQFTPGNLSSFGTDNDGEVYLLGLGNNMQIYRLEPIGIAPPAPPLLSETGAFTDLSNMTPADGVIPYEMNVPFWSDDAVKTRWVVLPNDGTHDTPEEQIDFSEMNEWDFPIGTVFIKHFEMVMDENNPSVKKKLETRFLVHGDNGKYYGITYKWRDDQTDADLLDNGDSDTLTITTASGTRQQIWDYPDRSTCLVCHNTASGQVLGPKTRQLNGHAFYPVTGRSSNQLETYEFLDWFETSINVADTATFLTSAPSADTSFSLELRARSYLDANCAYCHRPGTGNRGVFDARLNVPLFAQGYMYGQVSNDLGIAGGKVIIPQDTAKSILYQRMKSLADGVAMPPIAKHKVDTAGVRLIGEWIMDLDSTTYQQGVGLTGTYFNDMTLADTAFQRIDSIVEFQWGGGSPDPSMADDNFSVRWEGEVLPIFSETYTFTTNTDDGVRLWIDDSLIVDQWVNQGPTDHSGDIELVSGTRVNVKMEYFENGGGAVANLRWESASQIDEVIPSNFLFPKPGLLEQVIADPGVADKLITDPAFDIATTASSGLPVQYALLSGPAMLTGSLVTLTGIEGIVQIEITQVGDDFYGPADPLLVEFEVFDPLNFGGGAQGNYFDGVNFDTPILTRIDAEIDFGWGTGSPDVNVPINNFSIRWTGFIEAAYSETYTFRSHTDDGVRLIIDEDTIIEQWIPQAPTSHTGNIALTAGDKVPFVMEYYEAGGGAEARLYWSSPSVAEEIVPQAALFAPEEETFPVEWSDFTATYENERVDLRWITASENNSDKFLVERAGLDAEFDVVGEVDAQGYSAGPSAYQLFDLDPLLGWNYYRIHQVDLDGASSYSEVEQVLVRDLPIVAFPNPVVAGADLYVNLGTDLIQPVNLTLYTTGGKLIAGRQFARQEFQPILAMALPDNLAVGTYILNVELGSQVHHVQVLVR
ncbi:PA14 domain-containing protein [Pontibacter sp. G13]|uniref:PA14 domain-containing protein n=1 Tax=Pontibacter sp. G13 TaxID=3074898 RepID=UPI002889A66E|nr:PA14 domain-containing protein [Pontibacter sp. G13]WNJ16672.1 PA14 domain-containing protein [Pontibacter sp. G13]